MCSKDDFDKAIDAHYERIYRLAHVMSGNDHDARDLTQETFLEAFKNLQSFEGRATIATWLIGILRRRFLLALRRRPMESFPADVIAMPAHASQYSEMSAAVVPAIASLDEPLRTTLFLFYFEHLDYATIAEVLGCPIGTVRSRMHQGREILRRVLTPIFQENSP